MKTYDYKLKELIRIADKVATEKVDDLIKAKLPEYYIFMGADGRRAKWWYYTEFFHREMNRLAFEGGIRSWK